MKTPVMKWLVPFVVFVWGLAAPAVAQEDFFVRARLSGDQVVPSVVTEGSGWVTAILIGDVLVMVGEYQDLRGSLLPFGAQVWEAPEGENGGLAFSLSGDGGKEGKLTAVQTLTEEQILALREGGFYLQLRTQGHATGELRAQLAAEVAVADLAGVWRVAGQDFMFVEITDEGFAWWADSPGELDTRPQIFGTLSFDGSLLVFPRDRVCRRSGYYYVEVVSEDEARSGLHHDACPDRAGVFMGQ